MDTKTYNEGLADLRTLRADIGKAEKAVSAAQAALDKLVADRARKIMQLGSHEKAQAAKIAQAGGLSISDVVAIVPLLDPTPAELRTAAPQSQAVEVQVPVQVAPVPAVEHAVPAAEQEPEAAPAPAVPAPAPVEEPQAPAVQAAPAAVRAPQDTAQADPTDEPVFRPLPAIPDGPQAEAYTRLDPDRVSERPSFDQSLRSMVFLDAATGDMTLKSTVVRLQLGNRTPGEILDAVQAAAPGTRRIYITNGDPWHDGAERFPTLTAAVTWWLNTPSERWTTAIGRGRGTATGHFVHERNPVGRYTPVNAQSRAEDVEIMSAGSWFDTGGAPVDVVREAFLLMYTALRANAGWENAVLLGFPSVTSLDLWSRTIPKRGKWAGGYPVMSIELRELMHATAGQGRTELLLPPQVPAQLPALVEYDRIFAYAKSTWKSGVGAPERLTGRAFAALSEDERTRALMAPSHWNVKVTVPSGWDHVGLLPAPVPGERSWEYPARPGTSFTTWVSGPEMVIARKHNWRVEVVDALVWEAGSPLKEWGDKLKATWRSLSAQAELHGDPRMRQAYYLASRGIRSILLFGIGAFAQGPTLNTGFTPAGQQPPDGVEILSQDANGITWQQLSHYASHPHPHWSAATWGAARGALLEMQMRDGKEITATVGALTMPRGTVVAFRTDAVYLTQDPGWPSKGEPGDYLLKGALTGPVQAPTTVDELLALRDRGRAQLRSRG
ncbi:hypothetical protein [Kitasatospora griseola]|uniref:hypothetical protein n=1 Tax=Kitasatospora griseola TaxID=2064 RepID=UPI003449C687